MPAVMPEQEDEENVLMRLIKELRGNQTPEELGAEIANSPRQQALKGAVGAGQDFAAKTQDIMSRPVPRETPEELGKHIQDGDSSISALLMSRGRSHAKPLGAPSEGWHAPMAMPNQPRDISKPKPPEAPSQFTAAMLGQDPRSKPLPSEEDQAKMNGALRLPPIQAPVQASYKDMAGMGDPKGLIDEGSDRASMTAEHPTEMGYQDTPGGDMPEEDPQPQAMMTPMGGMGDGASLPPDARFPEAGPQPPTQGEQPLGMSPDDPREKLKAYLARQEQGKGPDPRDELMRQGIRGNEDANSRLGFYQLLMKAANQAGSVGDGKIASTDGFDGYAKNAMTQNQRSSELTAKRMDSVKKAQDDKLKGMMFLAKQKQDEEKYGQDLGFRRDQLKELGRTNDLNAGYKNDMLQATQGNTQAQQQYRQDMLDLKRNPPKNPVDDARIKLLNAQSDKAAREAKLPPKAAQDPVTKEYLAKLSGDNAKKISGLNTVKNIYKQLQGAKSESEQKNFARRVLKALQSADFGSDAVNASDEPRMMSYFNQVRPGDIISDGTEAFGSKPKKFMADIDRQIQYLEGTIADNQKELQAIQGGSVPGSTSIGPTRGMGTQNQPESLQPGMKWQVNTKTGARRQVPQ